MLSESPEDFIDDFSQDVTFKEKVYKAIFENEPTDDFGVVSSGPMIVGAYRDFGAAVKGDQLIVGSVNYEVSDPPQSDGQNLLTTLYLRVSR